MLSGTLIVTDTASGAETAYAPGQFVVEMVEPWHFGRNDGPGPLSLLVIDLVEAGRSDTVLQDP